jgi:hypothetical protein
MYVCENYEYTYTQTNNTHAHTLTLTHARTHTHTHTHTHKACGTSSRLLTIPSSTPPQKKNSGKAWFRSDCTSGVSAFPGGAGRFNTEVGSD